MRKLPGWTQPILFAMMTTAFASLLVSGLSTYQVVGPVADFPQRWARAWLLSWPVACPALYSIAPLVRRLLQRICE